EPRYGVSLSEGWRGLMDSALVAAHEIGHNFGAPHDGAEDSPCKSTPGLFLMAPALNGSTTFSDCSRAPMAPKIAAAACVVPARIADMTVSAADTVVASQNHPFDYAVDVISLPP